MMEDETRNNDIEGVICEGQRRHGFDPEINCHVPMLGLLTRTCNHLRCGINACN
jgi:hypothetical protein